MSVESDHEWGLLRNLSNTPALIFISGDGLYNVKEDHRLNGEQYFGGWKVSMLIQSPKPWLVWNWTHLSLTTKFLLGSEGWQQQIDDFDNIGVGLWDGTLICLQHAFWKWFLQGDLMGSFEILASPLFPTFLLVSSIGGRVLFIYFPSTHSLPIISQPYLRCNYKL